LLDEAGHKKIVQDKTWKEEFYAKDQDYMCEFLNQRKISVFAVTFMMHCMLTHLNVMSKKGGVLEHEVKVFSSNSFDGVKALKEWSVWLLSLGQDCDQDHYERKGSGYVFNPRDWSHVIPVPGIGRSQLDSRNQEVLAFAHSYIVEMLKDGKLMHAHELTPGSYGTKPTYFLVQPLMLGGFPRPEKKPWDEEAKGKESAAESAENEEE